jgi:hypothetical protein
MRRQAKRDAALDQPLDVGGKLPQTGTSPLACLDTLSMTDRLPGRSFRTVLCALSVSLLVGPFPQCIAASQAEESAAAGAAGAAAAVRGQIVLSRASHDWMSQQLELDTMLQTKWQGLYNDRTLYHVATPALYEIEGKWYLFAQACGRPANDDYIDGAWEMRCVACDRVIPTRPGCAVLWIPGGPTK